MRLWVRRHPYSWAGDDRSVTKGLITYKQHTSEENVERSNSDAERISLEELGEQASIKFWKSTDKIHKEYPKILWHPIDSQRLTLWAAERGRQEQFYEEMSKLHFEEAKSNGITANLLEAVRRAGLDDMAAKEYLDSQEDVDRIWSSYGRM
eukprot:UC4_evm1s1500